MKILEINKKDYHYKQSWTQLTLLDVSKIDAIEIPDDLLNALKMLCKDKLDKDFAFDFDKYTPYYRRVASVFTKAPLNEVPDVELNQFFSTELLGFLLDIKCRIPATFTLPDKRPDFFELKGEKYIFPTQEIVANNAILGRNLNIMQFKEASDLIINWQNGSNYESLALMVAVYCLKEGEEFSEELVLKRYQQFYELPMSVVLTVFFYIYKYSVMSVSDLVLSLSKEEQTQKASLRIKEADLQKSGLFRKYMRSLWKG